MKKPKFTNEALLNIEETCTNYELDLMRIGQLGWTPEEILADCLDGADEDRVQGWHDYVDAIVESL